MQKKMFIAAEHSLRLQFRMIEKCVLFILSFKTSDFSVETQNLNFHDGPSEFPPNKCRPIGPIGRHCLAGISKGHRGNSNFFLPLAPYTYHGPLSTGIREDAFLAAGRRPRQL